jgi:predicted nucleic acid-binding protein
LSVVIDNSMALAWTLTDEHNAISDAVLDAVMERGGHVPFIFRAEFANGLTTAFRGKRIDQKGRADALLSIETLNLIHDDDGKSRITVAVALADRYRLTVYDALYLELAQRLAFPLATFDRQLSRAAREAGVSLAVPQT